MSATTPSLRDSRLFDPYSARDDHSPSEHTVNGNDLRVGRFCLIGGHPCQVRTVRRSEPGKHGHAKLRLVGRGVFDNKRREAIYQAQRPVLVPSVETASDVLCVAVEDGLRQLDGGNDRFGLPPVLPYPQEDDSTEEVPKAGEHASVSVVVACGHFKVTSCRVVPTPSVAFEESLRTPWQVLSKKEQRRRKKLLRKEALMTAEAGQS
uniref:Translation initiation factor 5A-like N-terminal domain-containing protein n=1 Tax=Trieres chinensis TaxID=1514140 RepID=A0A7S2E6Q7_TRICV